jgi:hypothetical protein
VADTCEYGNELSGFINAGISCLAANPVSFSRRTLLHGVSKCVGIGMALVQICSF